MNIAFIGLGNMGAPMSANLATAKHRVSGFDLLTEAPLGVKQADSCKSAVSDADVVITMLPSGSILREVAAEALPAMRSRSLFIDCSTVDVESARAVAGDALERDILPLDAPVSGGVVGAVAGTLTFMVGGSEEAYRQAAPLFEIMGQKSVHCGASGNGQAAKVCNNMILASTMIATCEAFVLADKLGLDRQAMYDVVSTSSGYSWTMNVYCPAAGVGPQSPSDNNFEPGFASELMLKDLTLSQQAAKSVAAATPMGEKATQIYQHFVESGDGSGRDFSAIIKTLEKH